jgi:hypothetical protein
VHGRKLGGFWRLNREKKAGSQETSPKLLESPRSRQPVDESGAPELNPQEGIWNLLKGAELRNLYGRNLEHLGYEGSLASRRLRTHPDRILSCFERVSLKL